MKTLKSGLHLKLFTANQRGLCCSTEIALSRQQIGFLLHQNRLTNRLSVPPVSAVSPAQTNVESEKLQTISSDEPKTVHVRFKLNKECAFGQQFLIVGDDAVLGLWDPSDGVPLNWSEGHVWTAELEMPSSKVIKYKFILKGNTGIVSWQPGPDRILETWETERVITVSQDWDNPELQYIVEEDFVGDLSEDSLVNSDSLIVAEDLNQTVVEEWDNVVEELDNVDDGKDYSDKTLATMVAENISGLGSEKREEVTDLLSLKDETRHVLDEEVPVLVPGLVPTSTDEIESDEIKDSAQSEVKDENVSASLHSTETSELMFDEKGKFYGKETVTQFKDEHALAQLHYTETGAMMVNEKERLNGKETITLLKDKHVPASLHCAETGEVMVDEKLQNCGEGQIERDILDSDMRWGRRTIQKFLAKFGVHMT